jgi:hypothetical protein
VPRQPWTSPRPAFVCRFTLIVALFLSASLAGIAAAGAPTFLGTFTGPGLCSPRGVGLSPTGDVAVGSDCASPHIQFFSGTGSYLSAWGIAPPFIGPPNGVGMDGSGNVFVTDTEGNCAFKLTSGGGMLTIPTTGQPVDLALDGSGNVFVVTLVGKRVHKFANNGLPLATFGSAGSGPGQFVDPVGIGVDAGGRVYVADYTRGRVIRFLADGNFDAEFVTGSGVVDVAAGPDGNFYVVRFDASNGFSYSSTGTPLWSFSPSGGFSGAYRIAIGPTGAMYVTEQYNTRVSRFQIDQVTSATRTTFGRLKAMYR